MEASATAGRPLAIAAEVLYLTNLMLAPALAFLVLAILWWRHRSSATPVLARQHLRQAFWVSLWGGVLIGLTSAVLLTGLHLGTTGRAGLWMAVILYFLCIHSTLILLGVVALTRALAGQQYRYPLIGPRLRP